MIEQKSNAKLNKSKVTLEHGSNMVREVYAQKDVGKVKLYTGSYNAPVLTGDGNIYQGKGKGILVFLFDEKDGILEELESYLI